MNKVLVLQNKEYYNDNITIIYKIGYNIPAEFDNIPALQLIKSYKSFKVRWITVKYLRAGQVEVYNQYDGTNPDSVDIIQIENILNRLFNPYSGKFSDENYIPEYISIIPALF